jgi:hypothetical protein
METSSLLARVLAWLLARARLGEEALEEDLALRDQGQIDLAAAREQCAERVGPLDRGHLPGKRDGLLPGELAVRGRGDHGREVEDAVERAEGRGRGSSRRVG